MTLQMEPATRARKIASSILRAAQREATQAAIAAAMGVSESTISRLLSDHLDKFAHVLAHAGLKVVDAEFQCVDPKTFAAFEVLYAKAMSQTTPAKLIFEDAE
jgi:predicted XRE-type DNA-binding protein